MKIIEITEYSKTIEDALADLLPQLSKNAKIPKSEEVKRLIEADASRFLVAVDEEADNAIVGMLTLIVFRIPTGMRAWIEDVVVDTRQRGKGVGELLVKGAIESAKAAGAITVDLTSRPSREAANRLYRRCGFVARETNIYRYEIES